MATYKKLPKDPDKPDGPARAWRVQVTLGRNRETGKRTILTKTTRTKAEAEAWALQWEGEKGAGIPTQPSREPLKDYLEAWLKTKKRTVRDRTHADYQDLVRRYIADPPEGAPKIGLVPMDQLRAEQVEELYNWLQDERGLGPRTIRFLDSVLRSAFRDAVRKGTLRRVPAPARKDLPKQETEEVAAMTEEEARRFLQEAEKDRYPALWTLLLVTGMRPSEALGLQWRDLDGARLHIRRSLTRRGVPGWKLVPPKTKRGRRKVALPPLALDALARHRRAQAEDRLKAGADYAKHPGGGFVFATATGEPLEQTNLYRRNYRKILREAGLGTWEGEGERRRFVPGFTMYALRHTFASLDLRAGGNVKVTSAVLGHSDVSLTLNTYTHLIDAQQDEVADRMQTALGEAAPLEDLPGALRALAEEVEAETLEPASVESLGRIVAAFSRAHNVTSAEKRLKGAG